MPGSGTAIRAGRAFVELFADDSKLVRGLRRAQRRVRNFAKSVSGIGLAMVGFGTALAGALIAPVLAAAKRTETLNAFAAVFGEQTEKAAAFADELANRVGRSATDIKSAMTSFQGFFVGLGVGKQEASDFASELSALSVDFASFWNLSDDEAQQRFISALSGSAEVLDKFGVNLRVANLEPKLKELFGVGYQGATEMQKAIARLEIIRDVMGDQGAIGDATKTAGSFSNQLKRLQSGIQDLSADIGESLQAALLPWLGGLNSLIGTVRKIVQANGTWVVWILKVAVASIALGGAIVALGTTLGVLSFAFGGFAAAIGFVGGVLLALKAAFLLLISPIGLIVAAIAAVVYYSGLAGAALDWLQGLFADLGREATRIFGAISAALAEGDIAAAANVLWAALQLAWAKGTAALTAAWSAFKAGFAQSFIDIGFGLTAAWSKATAALRLMWIDLASSIRQLWTTTIDFVGRSYQQTVDGLAAAIIKMNPLLSREEKSQQLAILREDQQRRNAAGRPPTAAEKNTAIRQEAARQRASVRGELRGELAGIEQGRVGAQAANREQQDGQVADSQQRLAEARAAYEQALAEAGGKTGQSGDGGETGGTGGKAGLPGDIAERISQAMEEARKGMQDKAAAWGGGVEGTFSGFSSRMMFSEQSSILEKLDEMIAEQRKTREQLAGPEVKL